MFALLQMVQHQRHTGGIDSQIAAEPPRLFGAGNGHAAEAPARRSSAFGLQYALLHQLHDPALIGAAETA